MYVHILQITVWARLPTTESLIYVTSEQTGRVTEVASKCHIKGILCFPSPPSPSQ